MSRPPAGTEEGRAMVLVGRDAERSVIDAVLAGPPATVVVDGPAGIGKSRLVEAVAADLGDGWHVERAFGTPAGDGVPLGPFLHLHRAADPFPPSVGEQIVRLAAELRVRAAGRRLLLVVDDAHLLDGPSQLLLRLVTDAGGHVVAAGRTDGLLDGELGRMVHEGAPRLQLGPLDRCGCDALVRSLLGDTTGPDLLDEVWRRSEGHPLFATELVHEGLDRGAIARGPGGWDLAGPLSASAVAIDAIDDRIRRLGPGALDALVAVAVAEPLPASVLEHVVPVDDLVALEDKDLLQVRTERDRPALALGHPLYGEAALALAGAARLDAVRRRVADALAERDEPEPWAQALRARLHLEVGDDRPDLYLEVARSPLSLVDPAFALRCADAALGDLPSPAHPGHRPRAVALAGLGRIEEAIAVLERLRAASTGRTRAELTTEQAATLIFGAGDSERAEALLRAELDGLRVAESVPVRMLLSQVQFFSGQPRAALVTARPMLGSATSGHGALGSPGSVGAMTILGMAEEALALVEEGLDTVRTGDPSAMVAMTVAAHLLWGRMLALWQVGRLLEADDPSAPLAGTRLGPLRATLAFERALPASQRFLRGHLDGVVEDHVAAYTELAHTMQPALLFNHVLAATGAALRGDARRARAELAAVDEAPPALHRGFRFWTERARLLALAAEGDVGGALDRVDDLVAEHADELFHVTIGLHDHVRMGRAERAVERLERQASRPGATWYDRTACAHARAAASGSGDALLDVAAVLERGGLDLHACEAAHQAVDAYAVVGRRVQEAAARERATALLARCGPARTPALRPRVAGLTAREQQVTFLAASGLGNREIARRLGTSASTVNGQLTRVFRKLGVHRRDELASVLGRAGEGGGAPS